ncbi:MAG: DUF349 domain-containing protein [Bacteroidales bacterium]|nr:DUF349 domain-containing protein [Bacteroidales bacterium]
MSDLNSSVPEEQVGSQQNATDNTRELKTEPEQDTNQLQVESKGDSDVVIKEDQKLPGENEISSEGDWDRQKNNGTEALASDDSKPVDPGLTEDSEDMSPESDEAATVDPGRGGTGDDVLAETNEVKVNASDQVSEGETAVHEPEGLKEETGKPQEKDHERIDVHAEAKINYAALSMEDLVALLREMVGNKPVESIINDVDSIKINFYKKHKADIELKRKAFINMGGELDEFTVEQLPLELEMKELLRRFRDLKSEYNKVLEGQKTGNLEEKYKIIEQIRDLVTRKESINRTFQEFRDLQRQWREIGPVPQQNVKDMWDTYHHHVEAFYDFIRINQELRDLDLKKNLEAKIELCEKAEELLLDSNILHAFKNLQDLHEQWREVGPVPADMRVEIWDRFKEATAKINKNHQEHFIQLKSEQKKNLEAKIALCEKAEEFSNMEIRSHKEWVDFSRELMNLQKVWKTIGFAPKKDNVKIYKRFREACDSFFNRKREYYNSIKEDQNNNLQLKTELCIQAETLSESTEWKKTMEELIELQQRWKEIGPVPHKHSDKIWKRFRAACDKFFERKALHYSEVDNSFENNLIRKQELIREIEEFKQSDNAEYCLKKLKEFQRRWAEIGFVPLREKDEIHEKYRHAINQKFDQLKIDDGRKSILKFRTKIDNYLDKPNGMHRIRMEREKYVARLKQMENDIVLWENNIGFFTRSRNAESMIKEVENKIENTKKNIDLLNKKINMIDDLED